MIFSRLEGSVRLTDLKHPGLELQVAARDWSRILQMALLEKAIDGDRLFSLWDEGRIEVPQEMARKIGTFLEKKFFDDVREWMKKPSIPEYLRPIATSNGLWIDPALPVLNRPDQDYFYLRVANFCQICSGFSIG